jgi:hypothetical protein
LQGGIGYNEYREEKSQASKGSEKRCLVSIVLSIEGCMKTDCLAAELANQRLLTARIER